MGKVLDRVKWCAEATPWPWEIDTFEIDMNLSIVCYWDPMRVIGLNMALQLGDLDNL